MVRISVSNKFRFKRGTPNPPPGSTTALYYTCISPSSPSFSVPAPYACTDDRKKIVLRSKSGSLASNNYPLPYEGYNDCTWTFDLDAFSDGIEVSFDFFNLSECDRSYVKINNKRFCGSEKPPPVTLNAKDTIVFRSFGENTKSPGFKATYVAKSKIHGKMTITQGVFKRPGPGAFFQGKNIYSQYFWLQ